MLPFFTGVMAVGTDSLILSALLDPMAREFGLDGPLAGWAPAAHGMALAFAAPVVALTFARLPRRSLMLAGLALLLAGALAGALAGSFTMLLAARLLAGSGAGIFLPAAYAHAGDIAASRTRGRIMGRVMAGWSAALLAGVPLASALAGSFGWRAGFLPAAVLAGVAFWLIHATAGTAPAAPLPRFEVREARAFLARMAVPLGVNFLDMLSFYAVYTFLGLALAWEHPEAVALFGLCALSYGLGLLASTLSAALLDRFGMERATAATLLLLAGAIPFLAPALRVGPVLLAAMFAWGLLQGWCQTGIAAIAAAKGAGQRGLATALLGTTTYLAVAAGAAGGGLVLEVAGFSALTLAAGGAAAMAAVLLTDPRRYFAATLSTSSSIRKPPD